MYFNLILFRIASRQLRLLAALALLHCGDIAFSQERTNTLVITTSNVENSQVVAEAFCKAYDVPTGRILALDFPIGDSLSRTRWEDELRPRIAEWIEANDPEGKISNIVTTFGVPLAVSEWEDDRELKPWRDFYEDALKTRVERMNLSLERISKLRRNKEEALTVQSVTPAIEIRKAMDEALAKAQKYIATLSAGDLESANRMMQSEVRIVFGVQPFIQSLERQASSGSTTAAQSKLQYQFVRGGYESASSTIEMINREPASYERDSLIIRMLERQKGLLASIAWLQDQVRMIDDNDSMASLDSELALVLWPEYRRLGTTPNLLHRAYDGSPLRSVYRTFAVSRIDGSDDELAIALIDRAIEAKKEPRLTGKAYVDLRGVTGNKQLQNRNESWLKSVANQFSAVSNIELNVEETAQFFPVDGCPDAVLYCGWYSLGKYIDSFAFKPGAIACHLTSDAIGIHQQDDDGWCKNLIKNGATIVVGSVSEPEIFWIDGVDPKQKRVYPLRLSSGVVVFGCDLESESTASSD